MKQILLLATLLIAGLLAGCTSDAHKQLQPQGSVVQIPLAELPPMQASFYKIALDGKEIRFFAVKGNDGQVRTALDACDVCFKERKGYQQQGDVMLCRNCNLTFPIDQIGPSSISGCNPHFLPSQLAGDQVVVALDELKKGARFFP
jgi:uncharacterized membrane protein